ncbi:MAG: SDR family oxidoreductase [Tumebacillaceae bacterium]
MERGIVLITGTSSGFGLLTSVALAKEGYHVVAAMRDLGKSGRLLQAAQEAGVPEGRIEVVRLDVTEMESIPGVMAGILDKHGRIDVLINNAGYAKGGFVEDVPLEAWREQFETNVFGLIAMTKAVIPSMRERRAGKIVNISSISGRLGFPAMGPYSASKFAVEGFSEALRLEMLPFGVDVVLVEPAAYKTDIWDKGLEGMEVDLASPYVDLMRGMNKMARQSAERGGDPQEVVALIQSLLQTPAPRLRHPIGQGVKQMLFLRHFLPSNSVERIMIKRLQGGKR